MSPVDRLRCDARVAFHAGLEAADAGLSVRRALASRPLSEPHSPWALIAIGKAAGAMTQAALSSVSPRAPVAGTVVAAAAPNGKLPPGIDVCIGSHPVPDEHSVAAACAIEELACRGHFERVLVLLSGGASALCAAPASDLTLADKARTTELLLRSGAPIHELNCVRKHLSRLKGGGLARLLAPRTVRGLVVSDVIDDDLSVIGSGPLAADPTTLEDARRVLQRRDVWSLVPDAVRRRLGDPESEETPKPGDSVFDRIEQEIVSANRVGIGGCVEALEGLGYRVIRESTPVIGEARLAAGRLLDLIDDHNELLAVVAGGETTVTVRGDGRGGRNQEVALGFALMVERERPASLEGRAWAFLSGGTDGRDGPTDAAGALVDRGSLRRARSAGVDPLHQLERNNSYEVHGLAGDLLVTGATDTNVADLQILLLRPLAGANPQGS